MAKTLILTALPMEARAILRALRGKKPMPPHIEVHTIGIAGRRLSDVPRDGVARVLMVGLAGALDPSLHIGDVVVDGAADQIQLPPRVRRGNIFTAHRLASTPAEKATLFAKTGALAVDMEQAMARDFTASLNVPFVGIRAISDTADQVLDPLVLRLMKPNGSLRIISLVGVLLRRPALIPYLMRLGTNTNLALRQLGDAVVAVVS